MIKRAERIQPIGSFGIDRVAAAAEEAGGAHGGPVLRMAEPRHGSALPPEALETTRTKLDDPKSNSWLPFTGDLALRAAISDFSAEPVERLETIPDRVAGTKLAEAVASRV